MAYRILLVGGGSGGHVFPLAAVGKALREISLEKAKNVELIMLGEGRFFEEVAREFGFRYHKIMAGKIRRYFSFLNFLDYFKMILGFVQSLWQVFWIMPDAVFTKSGYASFFPVLAARLFLIPVYLHDSDAVPGLTSRIIGRWAKKIFLSFESACKFFPENKAEVVGNPVRSVMLDTTREEALLFFKLSPNLSTVVIFGGSQGAKSLNDIILQSIVLLTNNLQVIHQCGRENYERVKKALEQLTKEGGEKYASQISSRYRLFPFLNGREWSLAYTLGDVIISRGGSSALFEIASVGKPGIVVPIKNSPANHQYFNALEFVRCGGILLEEDNLTAGALMANIAQALRHRDEIGAGIRAFAKPEAAQRIAESILAAV